MIAFEPAPEQSEWQQKARSSPGSGSPPCPGRWTAPTMLIFLPLIKDLNEQGLLNLGVPVEYGGSGLDILTSCMVIEELAVADPGIAFHRHPELVCSPDDCGQPRAAGEIFSPDLRCRNTPVWRPLPSPSPMPVRRRGGLGHGPQGGRRYVLNGEKCFISNGDLAALYAVFANVDPSAGLKGLSAFLVRRSQA